MRIYLGFSGNVAFYTLVEDVKIEASVTTDPNNAVKLSNIAYSDNMPFTYSEGGNTLFLKQELKHHGVQADGPTGSPG